MRPESHEDFAPSATSGNIDSGLPEEDGATRSLLGDVEALIDDARTWFDAEIGYQKSRVGFAVGQTKRLFVLGLGALFFAVMALFGLTVGLLLALTPLITAWGATAVVVSALLIGAWLMVRKASGVWRAMIGALDEKASKPHD